MWKVDKPLWKLIGPRSSSVDSTQDVLHHPYLDLLGAMYMNFFSAIENNLCLCQKKKKKSSLTRQTLTAFNCNYPWQSHTLLITKKMLYKCMTRMTLDCPCRAAIIAWAQKSRQPRLGMHKWVRLIPKMDFFWIGLSIRREIIKCLVKLVGI